MTAADGALSPLFAFSKVSELTATGPGTFRGDVNGEWTVAGKPNGGYLLAMMGSAAVSVSAHDHVIAASAHYLHSPDPGLIAIDTELLRAGRSASQVRCRISQDDRPCDEALFTISQLEDSAVTYWDSGLPEMSDVPYESCSKFVPRLGEFRVAIMEQVELRMEPGFSAFSEGEPSGRAELRGWLALPYGEAFDPVSLLYAVDSFPPATLDLELAGWVPTLELTVYVRALPAPGPVRILQRAHLIREQKVDQSCFVWDHTGQLVAQGTQLAAIRLG
jgi:Thioesterase-like superfamily